MPTPTPNIAQLRNEAGAAALALDQFELENGVNPATKTPQQLAQHNAMLERVNAANQALRVAEHALGISHLTERD